MTRMANFTMSAPDRVPLSDNANYQIAFLDLSTFKWTKKPDPNAPDDRFLCTGKVYPNPINIFSGSHILFVLGYSEKPRPGQVVGITGLRYWDKEKNKLASANPFEHGGKGEFVLEQSGYEQRARWMWVMDQDTVKETYEYYLMLRVSINDGPFEPYTLDPKIKNEPGGSA